mmetsp:Transcript_24114/g.75627  ORF Transcript_24114/g.75627 Transcript_24114/m.75627 type:complete len:238 (-) Transcript_24114:405-1118(-)
MRDVLELPAGDEAPHPPRLRLGHALAVGLPLPDAPLLRHCAVEHGDLPPHLPVLAALVRDVAVEVAQLVAALLHQLGVQLAVVLDAALEGPRLDRPPAALVAGLEEGLQLLGHPQELELPGALHQVLRVHVELLVEPLQLVDALLEVRDGREHLHLLVPVPHDDAIDVLHRAPVEEHGVPEVPAHLVLALGAHLQLPLLDVQGHLEVVQLPRAVLPEGLQLAVYPLGLVAQLVVRRL